MIIFVNIHKFCILSSNASIVFDRVWKWLLRTSCKSSTKQYYLGQTDITHSTFKRDKSFIRIRKMKWTWTRGSSIHTYANQYPSLFHEKKVKIMQNLNIKQNRVNKTNNWVRRRTKRQNPITNFQDW